jgi:hypothetical protein
MLGPNDHRLKVKAEEVAKKESEKKKGEEEVRHV